MAERADDLEKRLRVLSETEYALARKDIAKEFELRASDLDAIYRRVRSTRKKLDFAKPVFTWPDPVDGHGLLSALCREIAKFVIADPAAILTMALWVIHAHAHEAFDVSPILLISSPVKGCGKSTALDVLALLVPRPLMSANTSAAALYRSTAERPTIIVDEADLYFSDDRALVAFFNAGHRRGVPFRRCEGEDNRVVEFDSWAPKVLAQIGLPRWPTITDRSIVIRLRRKLDHESCEKFRKSRCYPDLEDLRYMAARWAADHLDELRGADPVMPVSLHNRSADNWEPLFAIARTVGGDWPAKAEQAVTEIQHEDEDRRIELLADLRSIVEESGAPFLPTETILDALRNLSERPYRSINHGREINAHWLSRQLKPFDLRSEQVRPANGSGAKVRGYHTELIRKVCMRYLGLTEASERSEVSEAGDSDASNASLRPSQLDTENEDAVDL